MEDFANYSPKQKSEEEWMREADALFRSYRGKSETELLKAIYARAVEGKRNGTLTNEQIDAFYEKLLPALDSSKRKRLKKIVEELKKM